MAGTVFIEPRSRRVGVEGEERDEGGGGCGAAGGVLS